jgi:hypothetical protein
VEEFPTNSHRAKKGINEDQPKKIEKVVVGSVVRQKKPLGRRFLDTFFGGDAQGVVGYVMMDVLIPAAKDMIADAVTTGIERMIFGEVRSTSRRSSIRSNPSGGYVSYNRFSSGQTAGRREDPRDISRRARSSHDFDEIILATRVEAQEVIDSLFDLISNYEAATVSDLYELVGVSGNYTDEKWGWTDIRGAGVTRVRNGYLLDLPRPEQLK